MITKPQPLLLEGERVKLIPLNEIDAHALFEAGREPEIWQGFMEPITQLIDAETFISKALNDQAKGTAIPFGVYDKESKRIVGSTRLFDISLTHRQLEIGHTWHHPSVWRSRINTESKYLLLQYCFETFDMVRVQLKTDLRNTRSQAAIARLGAVKEGILRQHRIMYDGYIRDTVMFSIIDSEWPSVKTRLEGFLQQTY
jgi:RimJ/RimL family protein N-acetyltransferase